MSPDGAKQQFNSDSSYDVMPVAAGTVVACSVIAQQLRRCALKSTDRLASASVAHSDTVIRRVLRSLCRSLHAVDVHLFLVRSGDEGAGDVRLKYHSGNSASDQDLSALKQFQFHLISSRLRKALLQQQMIRVTPESPTGGRLISGLVRKLGCKAYLLCPLHVDGKLRGILGIACPNASESTAEVLELIQLNGAIVLGNILRLRREKRRRRKLQRWKRIADQACDFAISVDANLSICDTIRFELGSKTPALTGLRLGDVVARTFHRAMEKQIHTAVRTSGVRTCDFQLALGADGPRWFIARIEPGGSSPGAYATLYLTDNNPDKVHEEEIRELTNQLLKASRMSLLGQMSAEFAHQLSQPLQAILNYANLLEKRVGKQQYSEEQILTAMENIEISVNHSTDIIGSIRDFVKFKSLQTRDLSLEDIIDQTMVLVQPTARGWSADLIAPENSFEDVIVNVDRAQTIHVLVNLIVNALEACCQNGQERARVELTVSHDAVRKAVIVRVSDNGPGLPPDEPEIVFERFYTRKSEGLGMGLAISREVCESQGGRLAAENHADEPGCTFSVTLPLADEAGSDTAELDAIPATAIPAD